MVVLTLLILSVSGTEINFKVKLKFEFSSLFLQRNINNNDTAVIVHMFPFFFKTCFGHIVGNSVWVFPFAVVD